ncbi:MAG: hypothetical protein V3T72_14450, partial [Thermoanaerobaculia bacterium]
EVVAGFDENGTVGLQNDEIVDGDVFPHKVRAVTSIDHDRSIEAVKTQDFLLVFAAQHLLDTFLEPTLTPEDTTPSPSPIAATRLDHPVGILPQGTCIDVTTQRYTYPASSRVSRKVAAKAKVEAIVRDAVEARGAAIGAFFSAPGSPDVAVFPAALGGGTWSDSRAVAWSLFLDLELFGAFGHVTVAVEVEEVEVRKSDLRVLRVKYRGNFDDLYDFNVNAPFTFDGAIVQAGYLTLGMEGHVFEDRVEFEREVDDDLGIDLP